jgi:hypothetical protein
MNDVGGTFDVHEFFPLMIEIMLLNSTSETVHTDVIVARSFYTYVADIGVHDVRDITEEHAAEFIMMPVHDGRLLKRPSESTQKNRRFAIRAIFKTARKLGYQNLDPTPDIEVDALGTPKRKICISADIEALREGAPMGMVSTGLPAVLAFAEAGASNSEIRHLRGIDVDLRLLTVSLPGTGSLNARINSLTEWGGHVLDARLTELSSMDLIVVSTMRKPSLSNGAVSNAFRQITRNARLGDCGFNVDSVRGWRAREVFGISERIEDVAVFLGLRTLDGAARFIGYDWQDRR